MRIKNLLIGVALVGIVLTAGFYGCSEIDDGSNTVARPTPTGPSDNDAGPSESYSISTSLGRVDILSVEAVPAELLVRLNLKISPTDLPSFDRIVTAQLESDPFGSAAFIGTVLDNNGEQLYRLEFVSIDDESQRFRIVVADQSEQVVANHWETDSTIFESYEVHGRAHAFSVSKSSMAHCQELYQNGLVDGWFDRSALLSRSPNDKTLIASIESIQNLFRSSSLLTHGSAEAELMDRLFANPSIQKTIKENMGGPGDQAVINKLWRKVCGATGVCTFFACGFSGPNPVCATCGLVALGCAIVELFSWF